MRNRIGLNVEIGVSCGLHRIPLALAARVQAYSDRLRQAFFSLGQTDVKEAFIESPYGFALTDELSGSCRVTGHERLARFTYHRNKLHWLPFLSASAG